MPLIRVSRENNKVEVLIETDLANNCEGTQVASIPFTWQVAQPYEADLLARYIDKRIKDAISKTRKEYYEQGWKDAKSRKAGSKEEWFPGVL